MLGFIQVSGPSLDPEYRDGDFVITSKIPIIFNWLKPGDAVELRQPGYGTYIKLIAKVDWQHQEFLVIGLQPDSTDSRTFGPVRRQDLIGKVIWHIRKPIRHPPA